MFLAEVRPQRVDENQLRVGTLPEEKVADPLFAAGPDEKIRIGDAGRKEFALEGILVDTVRCQLTGDDALFAGALVDRARERTDALRRQLDRLQS